MKKSVFSEAMSGINDSYLDEALNYKAEKKIIRPFFKKAAVCAAALIAVISLSAVIGFSNQKPQILVGTTVITGKEVPVENTDRGISLASESGSLSVRLSLRRAESAAVTVTQGSVCVLEDGVILSEDKSVRVAEESDILWIIDSPDTDLVYEMKVETGKGEAELTLKFEKGKKLWVISKA